MLFDAAMRDGIDLDEVSGCTLRRVRRTKRQLTRLYDLSLKPAGLTANQFDLLASLVAASRGESIGISIGSLARNIGMHPTTLNRDLGPLIGAGLVRNAAHGGDARVRMVTITPKGRLRLRKAIPLWRRAQSALGAQIDEPGSGI
jgi:DNA-binding MarR family transcriptional regulator